MPVNTSVSEVPNWRISCACISDACVRVAHRGDVILIGNTNNPEGPICEFTLDEWRRFVTGIKLGDFDDIA